MGKGLMINVVVIAILLTAVGVLWMRMRFWKWSSKMRLEIIDTQRKTIEQLHEQRRYNTIPYDPAHARRNSEWPETIEDKEL